MDGSFATGTAPTTTSSTRPSPSSIGAAMCWARRRRRRSAPLPPGAGRQSWRALVLALAVLAAIVAPALALDQSPPPILQWFESRYQTIEERVPDLFQAGYGFVWLPPPFRADQGDSSVGYDVYNRFDLGRPDKP